MDRMKTFLMYLLIIIVFFVFSKVLEDGLIKQMYYNIDGTVDNTLLCSDGRTINPGLTVTEAKATRQNGYITLNIENNTSTYISEAYIKIDLYSKSGVHAITKYMEVSGLSDGESKTYKLNFKGSYVTRYEISLSKDYPDKQYIINVFGYEINTTDIFGMDLSNYINAESFKNFGHSIYESFTITVRNIPWWGWLGAWCIIVGVI